MTSMYTETDTLPDTVFWSLWKIIKFPEYFFPLPPGNFGEFTGIIAEEFRSWTE